jgi:hypothetical protein
LQLSIAGNDSLSPEGSWHSLSLPWFFVEYINKSRYKFDKAKTIINLSDGSKITSKSGCIGYAYGFSMLAEKRVIPQRNHSGIYIHPDEDNASLFYELRLTKSHWDCIQIIPSKPDELILRESTIDHESGEISFPSSLEQTYTKPALQGDEINAEVSVKCIMEINTMFTDTFKSIIP